MPKDTVTITDNRTREVLRAPRWRTAASRTTDLRQIRVDENDFGLMGYDPAFLNTANCKSKITFIDGDKGILEYRGLSHPSSSWRRIPTTWKWPTSS